MESRSEFIAEKVGELEQLCRKEGVPVTLQRRVIVETLASRVDHPTADQLHGLIGRSAPQISRTTVYRVLDRLVSLGIIRRISGQEARSRFDADTSRHHHVQCVFCGAVADYRDAALDKLPVPQRTGDGYEIFDYSINLTGICPGCLPKRAALRETSK